MPEICPKIAQDISKICLRYAQALPKVWGFILRKWDKMSPGRVHQLGQYVSGEVHNAVGQFVLGTKCLLTSRNTSQLQTEHNFCCCACQREPPVPHRLGLQNSSQTACGNWATEGRLCHWDQWCRWKVQGGAENPCRDQQSGGDHRSRRSGGCEACALPKRPGWELSGKTLNKDCTKSKGSLSKLCFPSKEVDLRNQVLVVGSRKTPL